MLALFDQGEIALYDQLCNRFGDRSEQGGDRITVRDASQREIALAVALQMWSAEVSVQVVVKTADISNLSFLALSDQLTRVCPQRPSVHQ